MIVTVQILESQLPRSLKLLARRPSLHTRGLRFVETVFAAPLGTGLIPRPNLATVAMIAAWEEDEHFEAFLGSPGGEAFTGGWQVRLQPLRIFGSWPGLGGLPERPLAVTDDEPVVVLTLGHVKPWRLLSFLRAALPAEKEVMKESGLLASTGFGRFPDLVSTFSVWRSAAAMRDYAYRRSGGHRAAVAIDRARPFHRHSAFIRFRPYLSAGEWSGTDPLAGLLPTSPTSAGPTAPDQTY